MVSKKQSLLSKLVVDFLENARMAALDLSCLYKEALCISHMNTISAK